MNIKGADEELEFWRDFIHTEQFATWLDESRPTPELSPHIVDLIRGEKPGRVLDVGSGVVSILRGTVPPELLTATDLLADYYQDIFDYPKHGIEKPLAVAAEDLHWSDEFQIVHMRNALDHCQDPFTVWRNLKRAVRSGGLLIVCGFENEGDFLHGLGMYQWNLSMSVGCLFLAGLDQKVRELEATYFEPVIGSVIICDNGRRWLSWAARRIV